MGLDMYLNQEIYIGGHFDHNKVKGIISIQTPLMLGRLKIDLKEVVSITLHMGYWRKANQIHRWFVENVQDGVDECQRAYVSIEELETLKSLCMDVLENKDFAERLLPAQEGFFFGGTEYDKYYFDQLEATIRIVDKCINSKYPGDFYYRSSW